jgi:transposase
VNLARHTLVDVLPDRSADTFARWLSEHPGVEVVSWDRGGEYAKTVRRIAPHAVQVADRFHLLKNLRDVVSRVLRQHEEILKLVPPPMNHFQRLTNLRLDRKASKERTREHTWKLFESIHAFSKKRMKNAQEARELGIHRHTVEKYPGLQNSAPKTPLHQEGKRHRTLRRLHPGALGAGLSQRHPNLAGDLRAGLPRCLQECR